jgi:hypothetical protein
MPDIAVFMIAPPSRYPLESMAKGMSVNRNLRIGADTLMKPSTVDAMRAWLVVASLAATFIDAVVLVALGVFDVPERVFESAPFRIGVAIAIVLTLFVTRRAARYAFRSAVASQHAIVCDTLGPTVFLSADCPLRLLVVFHLRLTRARVVPAAR